MFLRRLLKTPQISSSMGTIRTISSSLNPTRLTPALKRKLVANLKSSENPCDDVLRDMEEQGFQISQADLNRWASLMKKQGRQEKSLEIISFIQWRCRLMMNKHFLRPAAIQHQSSEFGRSTFRRVAKTVAPSVVNLDGTTNESYGSGILFGQGDKIITCGHVVLNLHKFRVSPVYRSKRFEVKITLNSGETFRGVVADCDPEYDLALVKIETPTRESLSPAKFGVSKDVGVGDMVLSIGNPMEFANSFSAGIISSVKRTNKEIDIEGNCQFYLQTDCAVNEGNSGGPVVNLDGEVIGVNCAGGDRGVGVGFAIPIDTVVKVIEERNW